MIKLILLSETYCQLKLTSLLFLKALLFFGNRAENFRFQFLSWKTLLEEKKVFIFEAVSSGCCQIFENFLDTHFYVLQTILLRESFIILKTTVLE
jgi:hypothetical protein